MKKFKNIALSIGKGFSDTLSNLEWFGIRVFGLLVVAVMVVTTYKAGWPYTEMVDPIITDEMTHSNWARALFIFLMTFIGLMWTCNSIEAYTKLCDHDCGCDEGECQKDK